MPHWLIGDVDDLGVVAAKALLIYVVALIGLRAAHRRTLAQWTAIDFAAAVAIGAILGRTAVAGEQSFLIGAVALMTILLAHYAATMARYLPWLARVSDHRVRVLVHRGEVRRREMLRCGLTDNDVLAKLRQQGVQSLAELRYVLYETKGELTIVRETDVRAGTPELVQRGLDDAADWPP